MTTFCAEFTTATITRNSDHDYTHAWAIVRANGSVKKHGFSSDAVLAHKAAEAQMPRGVRASDRKNPAMRRYWARMAKEQGFATVDALILHWETEAVAERSELRVEVVRTTKI